MATAEEKLDALGAQMKSMLLLMETFNRWCPEVDHFSTELTKEIKTLTSRVEALEVNNAPPSAPKREEEGRAMGHGAATSPQGNDGGTLILTHPLANGQSSTPNSPVHYHTAPTHNEGRLPKAQFPKFDGSHPKV